MPEHSGPDMRSVFSSHIDEIGYDPADRQLYVTFSSGKTAVYDGVPADVAARVLSSPSIGEALRAEIRGKYGHRYA